MLVESLSLRQRGRRGRRGSEAGPCGECWDEYLWRWWLVAERFVRPDRVEVAPPALDNDLGLSQRVEDFSIEQFITTACVEALDVTLFPGATWCDVGGLYADRCDPFLHRLGYKFRPIVGPYVTRHATQDEEIGQHIDYVDGLELAGDPDRQAFVGKLVDHIEHSIFPSVMGAILDKVVGPDVIAMLRPQSDAGSVRQPEPAALGLFMRHFQSLASPDPLDPLC